MKRKIIYTLMAFTLMIFSACKSYLDINTNPNQLTVTNPDFVLSGALVTTVQNTVNYVNPFASQWGGYLAASGGYSPSGDYVRYYNNPASYGNNVFNTAYSNMANYNYVEKNSTNQNYAAVCEIMKAYVFAQMVDIFGDVPYSQALTGFTYLYPLYDNQQTIYKKLANKLDSAVLLIQNTTSPAVSSTADVMFKGDMTKWAKLANTLHLRLLIRQSEVADAAYISSEISKITSNGMGFLAAGQDAMVQPGYQVANGLQNPNWNAYGASITGIDNDYFRISAFGVQMLQSLSDPRIDYICLKVGGDNFGKPGVVAVGGPYAGVDFGSPASTLTNSNNTSSIGPGINASGTQAQMFLSASQSLFLQAEAMLRGWISGDPAATYNTAISESFRVLGVPASKPASAYFNGVAAWPNSDLQSNLNSLIKQKWIANYVVDCLEAWSDFRRTGYPAVPKSKDPSITASTPYPVRLLYPQSEYNNNPNSVAKAMDNNGGAFTSVFGPRIFWDPN
ncbi:MAG TPA: SusD/RagB family nutrient-binding outer membrane lipoprotein [Cyclobacteriaceae bacterium]|jgi:hypothetical protein|nr:SusD/RagB family nutrient-binding outer membrane lipoprotein [Cyclobacteriaceae bacterium]